MDAVNYPISSYHCFGRGLEFFYKLLTVETIGRLRADKWEFFLCYDVGSIGSHIDVIRLFSAMV